ncbi:MAG TPA: hypothetical protein VEI02_11675, partial [Planctomycetota bacterium]|nr:hypothetical protein [Planctomycetota bacterium]
MRRPPSAAIFLLACAAGLATHAATFFGGFWRDDFGILERVERLGPAEAVARGVTRRFLEFVNDFWRPTSTALAAAESEIFGPRPALWRAASVALLIAAAGALWRLMRRGAPDPRLVPALVTATFVAAPCHAESLGWTVSGQQELLALALTLWAVERFVAGSAASLLLAALAYGAKESAFAAPAWMFGAAVVLLDADARRARRRLSVAHAAVWAATFAARLVVLGGFRRPYDPAGTGQSVADRVVPALHGVATALGPALTVVG